jgi:hypothetical protein
MYNTATEDLLEQLNNQDSCYYQMINLIKRTQGFSDEQERQIVEYCDFLQESFIILKADLNNVDWTQIILYYHKVKDHELCTEHSRGSSTEEVSKV